MLTSFFRAVFTITVFVSPYFCVPLYAQTAGSMGVGMCNDNGKLRKCDGSSLVNKAGLPLQGMWNQREFDKIEKDFQAWCSSTERFPDGQWKLIAFEYSFNLMFKTWKKWDDDRKRFEEWKVKNPTSAASALIEAIFWRTYAWNARGGGYASTVSKEGWELFRERMEKAKTVLTNSKNQAKSCPLWYSLMLDTLRDSGSPLVELETLYKEAAALFPEYHPIHFSMGSALSPRWGGNLERFDKFAREVVKITKQAEGYGLYARLYWTEDGPAPYTIQFPKGSKTPEWELMKSGFEDLMKRYPESTWNMNKFASFACRANDKATYLKLRQQLGTIIDSQLWPSGYSVDVCDYRFAKTG
ncbi:MAG: hypothetical protein K1X48_06250 [Burkholderiaceae bacterium]|nr:hypothetical protein [Burkholderiaceae bacterium]